MSTILYNKIKKELEIYAGYYNLVLKDKESYKKEQEYLSTISNPFLYSDPFHKNRFSITVSPKDCIEYIENPNLIDEDIKYLESKGYSNGYLGLFDVGYDSYLFNSKPILSLKVTEDILQFFEIYNLDKAVEICDKLCLNRIIVKRENLWIGINFSDDISALFYLFLDEPKVSKTKLKIGENIDYCVFKILAPFYIDNYFGNYILHDSRFSSLLLDFNEVKLLLKTIWAEYYIERLYKLREECCKYNNMFYCRLDQFIDTIINYCKN